MKRKGCIYEEYHNKGKHYTSGIGGTVLRKGVGTIRGRTKRFVGEFSYHGHRFRCRFYHFERVRAWLTDMIEKYQD